MSGTLSTTIYEVRRLIGDRRHGDPVVTDPMLEELIDATVDELVDELCVGTILTTGFVSIAPGTLTYAITLPGGIPSMLHLENLVSQSTGYPLERRDMDYVLSMRLNNTTSRGQSCEYALREDTTGTLTLELVSSPSAPDALDAYWQPIHLRTQSGGASGTTTTLSFTKPALTALRLRVAGKALSALAPEALLKLSPPKSQRFGGDLIAQSVALVQAEAARLHQGQYVDAVQRTR